MSTLLPEAAGFHEALRASKLPWIQVALSELARHVVEVPGPQSHPRIVDYHAITRFGPAPDSVAWCASFACFCLEHAAEEHPRSKASRDFRQWGVAFPPGLGCLGVHKSRLRPSRGHVTWIVGYDAKWRLVGLGGNQGDKLQLRAYPYRFFNCGFRMPKLWTPEPLPLLVPSGVGGSTR